MGIFRVQVSPALVGVLACSLVLACVNPGGGSAGAAQTYNRLVAGLERADGLFTTWLDPGRGRVFMELNEPAQGDLNHGGERPSGWLGACLYVEGLASGLGSNVVALDRGQLGATRLLEFREIAGRVFFELPNLDFRASSGDPAEVAATRESFARSVLWSTELLAVGPAGQRLIEITEFLVRDAHDSARSLTVDGGHWNLDLERSVLLPESSLCFPDNLEFEALLTFASDNPGSEVWQVTPLAKAVTLTQHHSFIRLPLPGFTALDWDPRAGGFAHTFIDSSAAPQAANRVQLAVRHRLRRQHPQQEQSAPYEPIVYYVDRSAPPAIRQALLEGASWWNEAFEAAGYTNAFQVEVLPADAHPLDVRYNVIQWVQRSSRGWSYGNGIRDPRTGEMIKGHVTLGALRVRQDCLIFEGLLGTGQSGTRSPNDPVEASLARLRQLSAHEVGHTLGLAHNFAASTYGRASVMDYPAPLVELVPTGVGDAMALTIENAYAVGIGDWDKVAIRHLYSDLGQDEAGLREAWLAQAYRAGMVYLTDSDSRSVDSADPRGSLWDNGEDAVSALVQLMRVRRVALEGFDLQRLSAGRSTALLEELFVPLFFMHRYQVQAAAKFVGGRSYQHALVGDGRAGMRVLSAQSQRGALDALMDCLRDSLEIPVGLHRLLGAATVVRGRQRELFVGRTGPFLDELGLVEAAARLVIAPLLAPARLERLVQQAEWDRDQLDLQQLLARLMESCLFAESPLSPERKAVVQHVLVDELLALASDSSASPHVRAVVETSLANVVRSWQARSATNTDDEEQIARRIRRFLDRDSAWRATRPAPRRLPPGSPIGCFASE